MKNIAFLTSGGDSPGMNAAIRAIVRTTLHYKKEPFAVYRGFQGLIEDEIKEMDVSSVANIIHKGGTIIKSARSEDFKEYKFRKIAFENLKKREIDGLIIIGGDGSFTGASIFSDEFNIKVIGIPGTIDNDLYGTDTTIGYDTALNTVVEAVDKIRDTAESHDRIFLVEVMGRDSGFIALRSGLAVGAQAIIVPEIPETIPKMYKDLDKAFKRKKGSIIVIVAEGPKEGHIFKLAEEIKSKYPNVDLRVSILGHLQRGGNPSCWDRVSASIMGVDAVKALLDGKNKIMIGTKGGSTVEVPLHEAIKHNKGLNKELVNHIEILHG